MDQIHYTGRRIRRGAFRDRQTIKIKGKEGLGINKEGIEVVLELEKHIADLQKKVGQLQNEIEKLKLHERIEEPETLKHRGLLIEVDDPFTIP